MSQHFTTISDPHLTALIRGGAVGILPTDTVYGLVACATNKDAITRLYTVKQRESQPGTIIAASIDDLAVLGFSRTELQQAAKYWPARLSVVLDATQVPDFLKHIRTSLAVRIPDDESLRQLLGATGPLMTTSANAPKAPTSRTIGDAVTYFGDAIDFYVDAGNLGERAPSTIIGFDHGAPIVYRNGAVTIDESAFSSDE